MDGDQSGCFTIAKSSFNLGDLKEGKKEKKKIPNGNQNFVETVGEKKKENPEAMEVMNLHKSNELSVNSDCCRLRVITIILRKYYCLCH